jgi:hypothetical protein
MCYTDSCATHIEKKQDFFFLGIKHNALSNEECPFLDICYNYEELEKPTVKPP